MNGTPKKPRRPAPAAKKPAPKAPRTETVKPETKKQADSAGDVSANLEVAEPTVAELAQLAEDPVETGVKVEPEAPATAEEIRPEITTEASAEPAAAAAGPIEQIEQKGTVLMADVLETTKKYSEEAKERFQSVFTELSDKAKANVDKSTKALEQFNEIAKGNVEALVESGKIATKGIESLGQDAAEFGRVSFEKASAAMKSLTSIKTPAEFFQVQSDLLSTAFDAFAKETAKNSEALLKIAGDVAQPISTRVSVITERVRSIAA